MADFDNGLPPVGTDITDNAVSSVNISSSEAEQADEKRISSVNISSSEAEQTDEKRIGSVNISKESMGSNWGTFL